MKTDVEMSCERAQQCIEADVDNELEAVRAAALAQHLRGCVECSARREAAVALASALRVRLPYHRAPQALRDRISAAAREEPVRFARARRTSRWALPLAAGLMLGVVLDQGLARSLFKPHTEVAMLDEVTAAHVRALQLSHLTDVLSTDQHTVKPWFAGKLDYSPPVQDYAGQGFALIGGRLDYLDHRPVAALVYKRRQHLINAFVWPAPQGSVPQASAVREGYNLVSFTTGGMSWWLVSDLNAEELQAFAAELRSHAVPIS